MQENENENKAIIISQSENLPDLQHVTPEHLKYLDALMDKLHSFQYNHIQTITRKELILWCVIFFVTLFIDGYFVSSLSLTDIFTEQLLFFSLGFGFYIGLAALICKAITGIFNFKVITVRMLQLITLSKLYEIIEKYFHFLDNYSSYALPALNLIYVSLLIYFSYRIIIVMVKSKWVRKVNIAFSFILTFSMTTVFLKDSFSKYVLRTNEIVVFEDYGAKRAKSFAKVYDMIDEVSQIKE